MLKILFELYSSKKPASIYTDCEETSKFHFGYVLAVNEKEIALQLISPDGEDDGLTVINTENVFRVETDGQYSEKMKKLCSENAIHLYELPINNDDISESVLLSAVKKKQVVSIELLDSGYDDVTGFVESISDGECKIRLIDEYGCEDGYSYISVEDITKISCDTQDEKRIRRLWQLSN